MALSRASKMGGVGLSGRRPPLTSPPPPTTVSPSKPAPQPPPPALPPEPTPEQAFLSSIHQRIQSTADLPFFTHHDLHPPDPPNKADFLVCPNPALTRSSSYQAKLEQLTTPDPYPPPPPRHCHSLHFYRWAKPQESPPGALPQVDAKPPSQGETRMASLRRRSNKAPEIMCYRLLMAKHWCLMADDRSSLKAAIEEIRLLRLACHGTSPLIPPPPASKGTTTDSNHSTTVSASGPIAAAASKAGQKPPASRGAVVQAAAASSTSSSPAVPPAPPITPTMLDSLVLEDLGPKPTIGKHNLLPLCGYFATLATDKEFSTTTSSSVPRRRSNDGASASSTTSSASGPPAPLNLMLDLAMVTKFCDAGSLRDRIFCGSRIAEREVMRWTEQILGALAHIHSLGIVHRAVDLDHILLVYAGTFPDVFNAKLSGMSHAIEFEGLDPEVPTVIEPRNKVFRRHLRYLQNQAKDTSIGTQAPEVRGLVEDGLLGCGLFVLGTGEAEGQWKNYLDGGEEVNFRCVSALDVWDLGCVAFQIMTKDLADHHQIVMSEAPLSRLLCVIPPRFDTPFRDGLTHMLVRDPRERLPAKQVFMKLLEVDRFIFSTKTEVEEEVKEEESNDDSSLKTKGSQVSKKLRRRRRKGRRTSSHKKKGSGGLLDASVGHTSEDEDQIEVMDPVEAGRQRAIQRVKEFKKRRWWDNLGTKGQQEVLRRREAARQAIYNSIRRREIVQAALLRLGVWAQRVLQKKEATGDIRNPLILPPPPPLPSEPPQEMPPDNQQELNQPQPKKKRRKKGRKVAINKKEAYSNKPTIPTGIAPMADTKERQTPSGQATDRMMGTTPPADAVTGSAPPPFSSRGATAEWAADVYSVRFRRLLEEKGVTGKQWNQMVADAKHRATVIVKDMAAKAEEEKEDRERRGLMARRDYKDLVNFEKNFVPYTAKELAKVYPFDDIFRRILIMPDEAPGQDAEQARATRAKEGERLEADRQVMMESLIRAYDALQPDCLAGVEEAARRITAVFRGLVVRAKMAKIWDDAEMQAMEQITKEEVDRVDSLKARWAATEWMRVEVMRVQSYSAWIKLTSPIWAFLQDKSCGPSIYFQAHVDHRHDQVVVACLVGDKSQAPECDHVQVIEVGPLRPETDYEASLVMDQDAVDTLMGAIQGADDTLQLSYMLRSLQMDDFTVYFTTSRPLEPPEPPKHVVAVVIRRYATVEDGHEPNNSTKTSVRLGYDGGSRRNDGNDMLPGKGREEAVRGGHSWSKTTLGLSGGNPLPVTIIEVSWDAYRSGRGTGDDSIDNNSREAEDITAFYVQRCLRYQHKSQGFQYQSEWVYCYKGPKRGCIDVVRGEEVRELFSTLRTRHDIQVGGNKKKTQENGTRGHDKEKKGDDASEEDQEEEKQKAEVEVLYRVTASNRFGWSEFCKKAGVVKVRCDDLLIGMDDDEDKEEDDPSDLHLNLSEFPFEAFGLKPDVLEQPEHWERSVILPSINRKYKPRVGKQVPALSAGGQIWHCYLPVDMAAIARRKDRAMKYRAKLMALGEKE